MRDLITLTTEEAIEEHGEETNHHRNWAFIMGSAFGYIQGKNLRNNSNDILSGLFGSNSFRRSIPDNLAHHTDNINGFIKAALEYIDRWQMYAELFSDEKYAC